LNKFTIDEKVKPNLMKIDSAVEAKRREKLSSIRKSRDNKKVDDILAKIKNACSTSENLFPLVLDAVENDVTMGEIINVMKSKWGLFDND
jgi:methylmalonyl-CoA mutase N-terminal domain/subunit